MGPARPSPSCSLPIRQKPLDLFGAALFLALILVGAEEARKPIPVRPTHSA
jgi:hypothetical protein